MAREKNARKRHMFLSDRWSAEDGLRFGMYLSALESVLLEAETPLTVGVFGPWGSGKTTMLRMLQQRLEAQAAKEREAGQEKLRTVWFTAWKYDRHEALWRAFILRVVEALYPRDEQGQRKVEVSSEEEKRLVEFLDRLVESLYHEVTWQGEATFQVDRSAAIKEGLIKLPLWLAFQVARLGEAAKDLGLTPQLAEIVGRQVQTYAMDQLVSMEQFEERFRQALRMALGEEGRLVVFVDDLDRCLPEKAVQVLEALKLFLHVEGTVFVLGMDPEVVRRGIEVHYGFRRQSGAGYDEGGLPITGDRYLQKLIQVTFNLPELDAPAREEFLRWLQRQVRGTRIDPLTRQVFARGLQPTPRQAKRALNVFLLLKRIAQEQERRRVIPRNSVAWPLLAKTVLIQTQWPELYALWRQIPTLIQTLEQEYRRRPWGEAEMLGLAPAQGAKPSLAQESEERAEASDAAARQSRGGLLEQYLTQPLRYRLLYDLLTWPDEVGEGRQRARFEGLRREELQVYLGLAGSVGEAAERQAEAAAEAELPGDLESMLTSRDPALLREALARLEEQEPDRDGPLHERARQRLVEVIHDPTRPAQERAAAGDALAALGDPRFDWLPPRPLGEGPGVRALLPARRWDAERRAWVEEPTWGFVRIPAGPFLMGSDPERDPDADEDEQPQHRVNLNYDYWIARYPVTVAQWRAFVEATGYKKFDKDALRDPDTRPVRWVTWHDALAYCHWLDEVLRKASRQVLEGGDLDEEAARFWQGLAEGRLRVTLPSEAEWEKAARGGLPSPAGRGAGGEGAGRIYPWGDDFDPNRANTEETGIGDTTAVGVFPTGASPYGVLDLSGNVWEWTRSLYRAYPYDPRDGREALKAGDLRVLRGGSFNNGLGDARAAVRDRDLPGLRGRNFGFRLAVVPVSVLSEG